MKIVFVNRFFHPDASATSQMLSDLAAHLAQRHDVHVVASRLKYDGSGDPLPAADHVGGTVVHRVWTSQFGRASLPGRTIDYLTFYASATARVLSLLKEGDVVVAMTDPPLISVPAAIAARVKRAQMINWLHDIFPEIAGELDFKHVARGVGAVLAWCRNRSLGAASRNVALGDVMAARVERLAVPKERIRVIHNWSSGEQIRPLAPEANHLREAWGLEGRFVVGYSGNMGRAHDFGSLLAAAALLAGRPEFVFLLIGDGKQRAALEAKVRSDGLPNVMFRPYQPRALLPQSLTAPDCHIVSLKPSLEGLIVPSKLYSSLAAGRPVIFIGSSDGEVARLMRRTPFGVCVPPDDARGLVGAIVRLRDDPEHRARLGAAARRMFEDEFDQPIALAKWRALLEDVAASRPRVQERLG